VKAATGAALKDCECLNACWVHEKQNTPRLQGKDRKPLIKATE